MIYGGIDPGKDGAIVILDYNCNIIKSVVVPMIGREYNKAEMVNILTLYSLSHCVLEDIHAVQISGRTGAFESGRGKGLWEMALVVLKVPHTLVQPKMWQQEMWQGVTKQYKQGPKKKVVDTKATSLIAAQRLFPDIDFRKSEGAENPHSGIIDALLMAEYCRRKYAK